MQFSQRVFARKREYSTPRVRRRYDKTSGASACGATLASPLPLWEREWLASPDARRVRGLPPRMQTPHPARTAHSRCKSIGVLLKNGGRRPPMATFSHKGRREEARLSPRPELGLAEQRPLPRGLPAPILRRGVAPAAPARRRPATAH